MVNSFPGFTSV